MVYYKAFVISNYRAIEGPLRIEVSKRSLTSVIGINESGKTTILHAIFAFDHFNDKLNENGRHLRDTANLLSTSPPPAMVEAEIHIDREDLVDLLDNLEKDQPDIKESISALKKKRVLPNEWRIRRNLATRAYSVEPQAGIDLGEIESFLAQEIIKRLPYTLFFDDFRDKVDEKIEITDPEKASGWLSIIKQLFLATDPGLSVFKLKTLEVRQRKTVLAKVRRKLNETLTHEWQYFRLDDREALEISIDYVEEGEADSLRQYIKLEVVETDARGDQHFFFISDRSKGFYWFFNFVMKLEFNPKLVGGAGKTIYLLDEPGSYLHAFAQQKLCSKLRQLSSHSAVIYCTHSHYLLDPDVIPLNSIYVADKDRNGRISLVQISNYKGSLPERRSALQPVFDALQIKPFALDLAGIKQTVIVEGIYDRLALEMFKENRDLFTLPSVGATSIKFYISLLVAWQLNFRALWDNDAEGRKCFDEAGSLFDEPIRSRCLRLLPSSGSKRILQDLFAGEDLKMFRQELSLDHACSFERTIHALFYDERRSEILKRVSSTTWSAFREVFESLSLEK